MQQKRNIMEHILKYNAVICSLMNQTMNNSVLVINNDEANYIQKCGEN